MNSASGQPTDGTASTLLDVAAVANAPEPGAAPAVSPVPDDADADLAARRATVERIIKGLGFCGRYLHYHSGGRSGRGPILCLLASRGGQMPQQELGLYFEIKPGSLSEILAKIEAAGLIERTRDPEDRRQLFVHLTDAGEREAERERRARERFQTNAFTCLTLAEREQLADMLEKIRTRWEELDA